MKTFDTGVEEGFYQTCAALLGASHDYKPWTHYKITRWNNRRPGNGRFPGFGTIRMFSPTCIHVSLRQPAITKVCRSMDEVYDLIRSRPAAE
jgi:hypothetical protein